MQHSQDFKRRGVNFTVDGRRLRAHYKAIDRKSWRDDVMMKRRSSSPPVFHNDIPEDDISFKKLTPLKDKNEEVELQTAKIRSYVKKPVKKLTAADERRQQLIKYKERKQLLKELERKNKPSKPVFKVCQVKHGYDLFANVASTKMKMVKIEKPKEVALKVKPNLKPKLKSVAAKKTNQKLKMVEPMAKQVKRMSFAPEGFQFTAPVDLKFPSPRKRPTSDKNAYVFPNDNLKSSLKAKESDNDEIELKKKEVSSIVAVTSNDGSNEKELGDSNIPETSKNFIIESERNTESENDKLQIGGVATFKKLVFEYTEMIKWKIRAWNLVTYEDDLPEFVMNEIDSAVEMAELVMTQRFKQFEDLIADCEFNRSEKEVTCEDLLGFWDMIYQQVENIEFQFDKLSKIKKNNWTSTAPKPKRKKRRVKRLTPKLEGKSSHLREHIAAARKLKKTEEFKSEEAAITNTPLSTLNNFKSVLSTPVTDRSAQKERRVTRSSSRREGSLSYLLMPTPARDDDIFFSAENDENLAETFVQSSSGETHVLDASSIKNKKKLRRSVCFALNTKADKNDDTSAYRTTPFTQRQKSRIKLSFSSSPTEESTSYLSESISDYKLFSDECSHSRCTPAMKELSLKSSSVKKKKSYFASTWKCDQYNTRRW